VAWCETISHRFWVWVQFLDWPPGGVNWKQKKCYSILNQGPDHCQIFIRPASSKDTRHNIRVLIWPTFLWVIEVKVRNATLTWHLSLLGHVWCSNLVWVFHGLRGNVLALRCLFLWDDIINMTANQSPAPVSYQNPVLVARANTYIYQFFSQKQLLMANMHTLQKFRNCYFWHKPFKHFLQKCF
jgi:hypothetical protein